MIEWKYCEAYYSTPFHRAKSGRYRTEIYRRIFDELDCPVDKTVLPAYDDLFYEPFYQLMRQQFLANKMERARELNADRVSLLHIAPAHNLDFRRITSHNLQHLGDSATEIWAALVTPADRFARVSTEDMFGRFPHHQHPHLAGWWDYISARYAWILE